MMHADDGHLTLTGASHSLANSDPSSGRHACALPDVERCGSKLFVHMSIEEVTTQIEQVPCGEPIRSSAD